MLQGAVDTVQDRLRVEVIVGARVAGVAIGLLCAPDTWSICQNAPLSE